MYREKQHSTKGDDPETIRLPVLRPIMAAILTLLGIFAVCIYGLEEHKIDEHVRDQVREAELLLHSHLEHDAQLLHGLSDALLRDRDLQGRWRAGDRASLQEYCRPLLDEMRSRYRVTHFYFHGLDRVCFLRVHHPDRHGDTIDRITLDQAVREDRCSWGIELGPLGTFTLRLVQPWRIDGRLAGYLELGEEIDAVCPMLKHVLDVDLVITIEKSLLTRPAWEEGMTILGRRGDWSLLPHAVIVDHTLGPLSTRSIARAIPSRQDDGNKRFECLIERRRCRGSPIALLDAAGKQVGNIIVLSDIGHEKTALRLLLSIILGFSVVITVLLIALFRRFIREIESRLTAVDADLRTEIRKRTCVEEELRQHRDNLETLVHTRTVELQTANRQLDLANRDLKSFLHVAAHDLKAPIRAMGTLADWIRDDCRGTIGETGKAYLDLLSQRANRLNRHVDRILEFSEISCTDTLARRTDLNTLVPDVIESIDPPHDIQIILEDKLPALTANPTRLAQVFHNLLSNAVGYMGRPTGTVKIGCVREGDRWRFSVSDDGPGIEEKYFAKIFEMFQTLSPRDEVESTGMGLAIVKRIVETYGGTVWVESTLGQGSTFFFTLPIQAPPSDGRMPAMSCAASRS